MCPFTMLYGIYMLMQVSRLLSTYMLIDTVRTFNTHTRIRNDKTETVKTIGTDYILQCDKCLQDQVNTTGIRLIRIIVRTVIVSHLHN